MKKVLAILLAALMFCGVGAAGALASYDPEAYQRNAMRDSYNLLRNWPLGDEDLNMALENGKSLNDFFEDFLAASPGWYSDSEGNWYQITILESFALNDAVIAEYFNSAFVQKYKAWQTALMNRAVAYTELLAFLSYGDGSPSNPYVNTVRDDYAVRYRIPFEENGELTLAQATIVLQELESEIRALIDTLSNPEPEPDPDPIFALLAGFLPESLASVATFIVKYIFFGWLWGQWL